MASGLFTTESAEAKESEGKGFSKSLDPNPSHSSVSSFSALSVVKST
jgi:hypothetical protein